MFSEDSWLEAAYDDRNDYYDALVDDPEYFEDDYYGDDEPMTQQEINEWESYRSAAGIY